MPDVIAEVRGRVGFITLIGIVTLIISIYGWSYEPAG
jgi:hypothetical protein